MPYKNPEDKKANKALLKNRIAHRARQKIYRATQNGARVHKETTERWRKTAKGRQVCSAKAKRYANSSRGCATIQRWKTSITGRIKRRTAQSRRRAREAKALIGSYQALEKIYARARELRQWFDVVVDHIIPLAKGGAHEPGNLQIIYRLENLKKSARLDFQPTVIFR